MIFKFKDFPIFTQKIIIMIQRIQTVYLLVSIICLSIVSFGTTIFTGFIDKGKWVLTSHSIDKKMFNTELDKLSPMPIYIMFLVLVLICLLTIFNYKNLKRQIMIARVTAVLYFLSIAIVIVNIYLIYSESKSISFGFGFYLLIIGLSTSILAINSIKKDYKLIDSLNRLR